MASFTLQLRTYCEWLSEQGNTGFKPHEIISIVNYCAPIIFSNPIEWYTPDIGPRVYRKILHHYYFQELAYETVELWKHRIWEHLNLNAPYWNQLYESADFQYNPLHDYDFVKWHAGTESGTDDGSNSEQNEYNKRGTDTGTDGRKLDRTFTRTDLFSNTPQGRLNEVLNGTYLTDARAINEKTGETEDKDHDYRATSDTTGDIKRHHSNNTTGQNEYNETIKGKLGGKSYQQLIQEYRDIILNIDEIIVNSVNKYFFQLWEVQ